LCGYKLALYLAATAIGWVGGAGTMSEAVHDLGALRALREVGRRGSIAAAATVLGVSQQALSARMRTLERTMNVILLVRLPRGSHLTEQGRLIVGWAEDVLDAADRLEAGLRSIRSGVSHRLAIAASQTVAEHLVPRWLVELRGIEQASAEQAPGHTPTVVELTVANSTRVIELVRDVKVRLGFIETPHLPADLVTAHLRDDEMLVVTAPGHPWARRRRPLSLAEIAATPMVMREAGSGTRVTLTDHLAAQHPPLSARIAMELGTSAAVRSAIAEGVGPGVLSRLAVRDDLVLGRLVAIEVAGPPLIRPLTAVWRPDLDPLPPEAARLLAVAKSAAPFRRLTSARSRGDDFRLGEMDQPDVRMGGDGLDLPGGQRGADRRGQRERAELTGAEGGQPGHDRGQQHVRLLGEPGGLLAGVAARLASGRLVRRRRGRRPGVLDHHLDERAFLAGGLEAGQFPLQPGLESGVGHPALPYTTRSVEP